MGNLSPVFKTPGNHFRPVRRASVNPTFCVDIISPDTPDIGGNQQGALIADFRWLPLNWRGFQRSPGVWRGYAGAIVYRSDN